MKALTLYQPWASLVALGTKTIETRSWKTNYRGPLLIHAGKKRPASSENSCASDIGDWHISKGKNGYEMATHTNYGNVVDLPLGAIVAKVNLVDCVPIVDIETHTMEQQYVAASSDGNGVWAFEQTGHGVLRGKLRAHQLPYGDFTRGRFAWLLDEIEPLDPIPAKGRQGLWEWEEEA